MKGFRDENGNIMKGFDDKKGIIIQFRVNERGSMKGFTGIDGSTLR